MDRVIPAIAAVLVLSVPAQAGGGPKWIAASGCFEIGLAASPVREIPSEIPVDILGPDGRDPRTKEEFFCINIHSIAPNPLFVHLFETQGSIVWFRGAIDPLSGDEGESIVWPEGSQPVLTLTDRRRIPATEVVAVRGTSPEFEGGKLIRLYPQRDMVTYSDIHIDARNLEGNLVFVGFPRCFNAVEITSFEFTRLDANRSGKGVGTARASTERGGPR